jgi:hypothetical protein
MLVLVRSFQEMSDDRVTSSHNYSGYWEMGLPRTETNLTQFQF